MIFRAVYRTLMQMEVGRQDIARPTAVRAHGRAKVEQCRSNCRRAHGRAKVEQCRSNCRRAHGRAKVEQCRSNCRRAHGRAKLEQCRSNCRRAHGRAKPGQQEQWRRLRSDTRIRMALTQPNCCMNSPATTPLAAIHAPLKRRSYRVQDPAMENPLNVLTSPLWRRADQPHRHPGFPAGSAARVLLP